MNKIIQIYPWIDNKELREVSKVIKSSFLTENKFTEKFENQFKKLTGAKYAVAVNNWTLGIYCCLNALDIGKDDEVIVPNITFVATANAVLLAGAKVVLCDVDQKTLNISTEKIRLCITKKTKAIIPVHLYGNSCEMDEIKKIAKEYNLKIIEDAAQGLGVYYKKKHVGIIGDVGGFSFYGNKLITTGEGGIVVTNNKKIYEKIKVLKNHGRKKKGIFIHKEIGYNFMFTELQAALGIAQLSKLKKIIKKKYEIYNFYKKKFLNNKHINYIEQIDNTISVHWFTNVLVRNVSKLQKYLKLKKIETRRCFYPLSLQPCYKKNLNVVKKYTNDNAAMKIYNSFLSLPSAVQIKNIDLRSVSNQIKIYFNERFKARD